MKRFSLLDVSSFILRQSTAFEFFNNFSGKRSESKSRQFSEDFLKSYFRSIKKDAELCVQFSLVLLFKKL